MTKTYKPWAVGCLIYGIGVTLLAVAVVALSSVLQATGSSEEDITGLFGPLACGVYLIWGAGSIPGLVILAQKKYLAWFSAIFSGLGCVVLILIGWIAIPILCTLWMMAGPFLWLIALVVPPRRQCPNCKKIIAGSATRCPHCTSELTPIR